MRKFVFVDTNIFEHFPPLTDVDWAGLVDCSSVTLVIPQVTIRELNRHKDTSQKPRQKRRAAAALRKLFEWAQAPSPVTVRPSVELVFRHQEPLIDFAAFHLRHDVADDEFLASAIEFAAERQLGPESVLVSSADLGLQLKGQSQEAIRMLLMPNSLRLPDEPDSEDKRVKELEERVQQLSSRLPKLNLTFVHGATFEERTLNRTIRPIDEHEIAETMKALRVEHPYLADHPCPPRGWMFSRAGEAERQEYNKELHEYFLRYERFLRTYIEVTNWQARTRSLCLTLENNGGVPAEDISIHLSFPPGIEIIADSDFKAIPKPPTPPDFPGEGVVHGGPNISRDETMMESLRKTSEGPSAVITKIRKSLGCFEAEILVSRLRHTFTEHLPAVNYHFPSVERFKSFQFTYKMVASNIPQAIEGTLNVKIMGKG
ncbi:MAG: hypothetical protein LAN59_04710 [Acidobacteriia bacterium]|nr:hypothetical protein [Terriglobia bacterium]